MKKLLLVGMCTCLLEGCAKVVDNNGVTDSVKRIYAFHPERYSMPDEEEYISFTESFDTDKWQKDYEHWWTQRRDLRDAASPYQSYLDSFTEKTLPVMLIPEQNENKVYSPLNLYLALGLLAESTDGSSRQQILDLLGTSDMETLRKVANSQWNANYSTDACLTSILSNSLWVDNAFPFKESLLKTLSDDYHADVFSGDMGSEEMNNAVKNWIDETTGNLLQDVSDGIELDVETKLVLVSSILYQARWNSEFLKESTTEETFHSPDGDLTVEMMHASHGSYYFFTENYSAISLPLSNSGSMWFVLPDEGVDIRTLLSDNKVMKMVSSMGSTVESMYLIIDMAIPKMDIMSDTDLNAPLEIFGVRDVFDQAIADFSAATDEDLWLEQAKHAARVKTDEEGVSAAAFTMFSATGTGAPPEDRIDFIVDRPFLFILTGETGSVLFVGVVNNPNG